MATITRKQVSAKVANREEFVISTGSLRGIVGNDAKNHLTGWLNDEERARFLSDGFHGIEYLIVSYDTPVAWFVNGVGYKVSQKFSATTSKHLGLFSV